MERRELEKEGRTITALKPLENRRVRAVASERYPLNEVCAHPECSEPTADPHHIFPRSLIAGDSWFVQIDYTLHESTGAGGDVHPLSEGEIIPHVAGLCRAHHDDVEEHRAWIKLEDGEFVWYARERNADENGQGFDRVGPLNPQPGSRTGKPKRKKFKGEKRRKRTTISIKVPKDAQEDGAGVWDDRLEQAQTRMEADGELDPDRPPYYLITDILYDWATRPKGD